MESSYQQQQVRRRLITAASLCSKIIKMNFEYLMKEEARI